MTAREKQIAEINHLKLALKTTRSKYSRRDYIKGIKRKTKELRIYDNFQKQQEGQS